LGLTIGDCIHNARSALDNLVCALIRRHDLFHRCKSRAFPICDTDDKYAKRKAQGDLDGVPALAITFIDNLQPHIRGNTAHQDPLWLLNELSNQDKHRVPTVVASFHQRTQLAIFEKGSDELVLLLNSPRLKANAPLLLTDIPPRLKPNMNFKVNGIPTIAFEDVGPWGERSVDEVL